MNCNICDEELNVPEIICPVCNNKQEIVDGRLVEYLVAHYQNLRNNIIEHSKDSYEDTYKTIAVKNTKLEVFRDVVSMLEVAFKEYTNIDPSKIEIEEHPVPTPRVCQMNHNKICNI